MKSNLERFQVTKLCPFQEKIRRQYLSTNVRQQSDFGLISYVVNDEINLFWSKQVGILGFFFLLLSTFLFYLKKKNGEAKVNRT